MKKETGAMIRTIWFILAMTPLVVLAFALALLSLVATSPLMIYAGIKGKHLKPDGRRRELIFHKESN